MSRFWKVSLLILGLVVLVAGCGTAVYQSTLQTIKPQNFPGLIPVVDSKRCGEVIFKTIHQGISISTYDCYVTEAPFYDVAVFYVGDGYASPGRLFRYQSYDFPTRSSLTHKVHINNRDNPTMQVRVTTQYTAQLPKFERMPGQLFARPQRSEWEGNYPPP